MKEAFVIGDIHGQFDALMRLVKHAPKGCPIISVGDLNDRGPKTADVIEWFIETPEADAIAGNHEHMMIDFYRGTKIYGEDSLGKHVWMYPGNGGSKTRASYFRPPWVMGRPPAKHLRWLETRDFYKIVGDNNPLLITHAPLNPRDELFEANEHCQIKTIYHPDFDLSLMWNRRAPKKRSFYQVFGHCAEWGLRPFAEPGSEHTYAICIDQSRKEILTGFHWPSGEIFEEPFKIISET